MAIKLTLQRIVYGVGDDKRQLNCLAALCRKNGGRGSTDLADGVSRHGYGSLGSIDSLYEADGKSGCFDAGDIKVGGCAGVLGGGEVRNCRSTSTQYVRSVALT